MKTVTILFFLNFSFFFLTSTLMASDTYINSKNIFMPHEGGIWSPTPNWSAGIEVGNQVIGLTAQGFAQLDGALDFHLGFLPLTFAADYLFVLNDSFSQVYFRPSSTIEPHRGQVLFMFGGGLAVSESLGLRFPFKAEYVMIANPVAFFMGIIPGIASIIGKESPYLTWSIALGVRFLI